MKQTSVFLYVIMSPISLHSDNLYIMKLCQVENSNWNQYNQIWEPLGNEMLHLKGSY